ncbi:MAG: Uma2 family endonuclease [Phycisphaerae bacterium]|nr:Uma2 family endonuclease [Phycisphaerae bacterium]
MAGTATKARYSAAAFEMRFGDAPLCELERGEVIRLSPGGLDHGRPAMNIAFLIEAWARQARRGRVYTNETGVVTQRDPDTVRGADVAYFSYERLPRETRPRGFATVAPELIVEVVGKSQGSGKMVEKAGEYLRMGVDRVWIVNPDTRTVHVFRPDAEPQRFGEADTLADGAVLPEFSCGVAEIFED